MMRAPETLKGQIVAYAVGGGAVTAFHSFTYWLFARLFAVEPYLANSCAAIFAGLLGYMLHSRWTFGVGAKANSASQSFVRYIIVSVLCYALNSFWVWLVVKRLGWSIELSLLPMVLATPWLGFVLNRFWAFKRG